MTAATNVGLVRSNNEDNFIVCPDLSVKNKWFIPANPNEIMSLGERGCVMIVADGMGGMNAGEVASELAVNSIKDTFEKVKDFSQIADCSNHIENFLKRAIVDADAVIKKKVKEDASTSGMGTTIVVAWVVGEVAHIAWCGDSRAYLFNRSAGLSRLSNDHSYVQELVDTGQLDPELAFDHPNSNIITRSLGDSSTKARPDYVCKRLSTGDYLLLCTDGLCGLCRDEEILDIMMRQYSDIKDYIRALFNAAFAAGGYDNVTIALMECISVKEEDLASTVGLKPHKIQSKPNEQETKRNAPKKRRGKILLWLIVAFVVLVVIGMSVYKTTGIPQPVKSIFQSSEVEVENSDVQTDGESPEAAEENSGEQTDGESTEAAEGNSELLKAGEDSKATE